MQLDRRYLYVGKNDHEILFYAFHSWGFLWMVVGRSILEGPELKTPMK